MRKLSELLEIVRDDIQSRPLVFGMCNTVLTLYREDVFDQMDSISTIHYLYDNDPLVRYSGAYWWAPGEAEPRINWLNKHIEKLKSEGL